MGRYDDGRSRSPKGGKEWISRSIVQMGRYKDRRPSGFHVDAEGAFKLSNLMSTWGKAQSLTQEEILEVLQKNSINTRSGGNRFSMKQESCGDYTIWVHKAGGSTGGRGWNASDGKSAASQSAPWKDNGNSAWGATAQPATDTAKSSDAWSWNDSSQQSWNKPQDSSWPPASNWKNGDSSHGTSSGSRAAKGGGGQAEHVQRYVGFLLKRGNEEGMKIHTNGWASLTDIVDTMKRKRSDLDVGDADALQKLLQETDSAGRFEIQDGWIRKIDRDQRTAPQNSARPQQSTTSSLPEPAGAPPSQPASQTYAAPFNAWAKQETDEAKVDWGGDDEAPETARGVSAVKAEPVDDERSDGRSAPKKPPGKHWTMYDDGGTYWWYYEGPKGVWWMGPEHDKPQPFGE